MSSHEYDIHGILTVASDVSLPTLQHFRTSGLDQPPDLTIEVGKVPLDRTERRRVSPTKQQFWDPDGRVLTVDQMLGTRVEIGGLTTSPVVRANRRYLLVGKFASLVLSMLQHLFLRRRAALAFAAGCVTPDGRGVLLVGPPGAGKSTTAAHLAHEHDWRLLGDDLVLLDAGQAASFPKPIKFGEDSPVADYPAVRDYLRNGTTRDRLRRFVVESGRIPDAVDAVLDRSLPSKYRVPPDVLGSVEDRTDVDVCVFLSQDDRTASNTVTRLPDEEAAMRSTFLNWWISNQLTSHPLVRRASYFDPEVNTYHEICTPLTALRRTVRDATGYEVHGSPARFCDRIAAIAS